jgi:hypothetical protein
MTALSAKERKAAEIQRKKDQGYKQINFHLSPTAAAHLKDLARVLDISQSLVLERALADAHEKQEWLGLIDSLVITDDMRPKAAAYHLLDACQGDPDKAEQAYAEYIARKNPAFRSAKSPECKRLDTRYRSVVYNHLQKLPRPAKSE